MSTASFALQGRYPVATFLRYPMDVLHDFANLICATPSIDVRNVLRSMGRISPSGDIPVNHRTVNYFALNQPMSDLRLIRKANLRILMRRRGLTLKDLASALGNYQSYWSEMLSLDSKKSFGEKAARRIESKLGLSDGWMDESRSDEPEWAEAKPAQTSAISPLDHAHVLREPEPRPYLGSDAGDVPMSESEKQMVLTLMAQLDAAERGRWIAELFSAAQRTEKERKNAVR